MNKLLIAIVLAIAVSPADATDALCSGDWVQNQDREVVGNCIIKYDTQAFMQMKEYCDRKAWTCKFNGHVQLHVGELLYIDRISPVAEGAPDGYSFEAPAYYYNKAIDTCAHSGGACLKKLWDKADQDLDAIYQGRFSYLPKSEFDGLKAAQQAWALSRDRNCSWLTKGRQTDIYYACMLEGSINRKYWLLRNIGD